MRAHGIPHPDPDANGDFHLTPAQDKAMHSVSRKQHEAADAACFHLLKGTVSTQPLSRGARRAALVPLGEVRQCMLGFGYQLRQADREEHEPGTRDVRLCAHTATEGREGTREDHGRGAHVREAREARGEDRRDHQGRPRRTRRTSVANTAARLTRLNQPLMPGHAELVLRVPDALLELPAIGGRLAALDRLELGLRLLELLLRARVVDLAA